MTIRSMIRRLADPAARWIYARKSGDPAAAQVALEAYQGAIDALEAAALAADDAEGLAAVERERAFIASAPGATGA
jgi:hypothetical protein